MKNYINKSFIDYDEEMGEVVIDTLFVSPEDRGKKLGYQLIDMAVEYARELGLNVSLCAYPQYDGNLDKETLIQYYHNYGFVSDGDCDELMTFTMDGGRS